MVDTQRNKPIKWAATLSHVREVSLRGVADLGYWKERLARECLVPDEKEGHAQILIIAGDLKFKGIRFRELSFCVLVSLDADGKKQEGAYLLQAFNTSRLLSFCERVFFSTPYRHGHVRVSASLPASAEVGVDGDCPFKVAMADNDASVAREPSHDGVDGWEGPVILPTTRPSQRGKGKMFFARVEGRTRTYPFHAANDAIAIRPSPHSEVFQALLDSHFVATEWILREDSLHAKSKTYTRAKMLPNMPTE